MMRGHLRPEICVPDFSVRIFESGHLRPETSVSDISVPDICVWTFIKIFTKRPDSFRPDANARDSNVQDGCFRTQMFGADVSGRK